MIVNRPIVRQEFTNIALPIIGGAAAVPLFAAGTLQSLITSILISNPVGGPIVVFGSANVNALAGNGPQIQPGTTLPLVIRQERQLYEIQAPLVDPQCLPAESIPFVVWDVANIYVASSGNVTLGIMLFKSSYI